MPFVAALIYFIKGNNDMIVLFKIISEMMNELKILANKLLLPRDWNHGSMLHQNESVRYNC